MLTKGSNFAHFEIISELGRGGMGTVYLARDAKLTRQVALKILSSEIFDDKEHRERFHREARTAAQVTHQNVMAIYDIGSAPAPESGKELNYIVMEHIKGVPLNKYLVTNKPDIQASIRLAEQIAAGLSAAHKMKIVHRDIKPENIIITEDGTPKILDFGLAKPVDPVQLDGPGDATNTVSQELTKAGKILGTVKYMSPEQVQGKPVDHRSDIFSFGILMYIIFSGETPFAAETQVSTMAKILETKHPAITEKNPVLPPEVERIIDKCLAKDANDRYQDTRDLVVDLRNLRRQFDSGITSSYSGITAQPSSIEKRLSHKKLWEIIGGLVIVMIAMAYLLGWFDLFLGNSQEAEVQAGGNSLAIVGFENKTGDESLEWMETGLPEILLTDLSQGLGLQIISQQRIFDCFETDRSVEHTVTECSEAAQRLGAGQILTGSFFKLGDKLRIDARLEEISSGTVILAEKVVGDDPFELVNSLTAKIAASLELEGIAQASATPVTTPEAFKEFHLGMEFYLANDYDSAIVRFERAIEIDSGFALPYMRMGMAHLFSGRQGEGTTFLRLASDHRNNLSPLEKNQLDIYIDTWVVSNLDNAFSSLAKLIRDYPNDAEIRTIYALFINVFKQDTTATFAQLDTVLTKYPSYPFAISQYAAILRNHGLFDRYEEMIVRLNTVLPNSVFAQTSLIRVRQRQGRFAESLELAEKLHEQVPTDKRPIYRLIATSLHMGNPAYAREWVEKLRALAPEDPYILYGVEDLLVNINIWEGHFQQAKRNLIRAYELSLEINDSAYIVTALNNLTSHYNRFEQLDSMVIFETMAFGYAVDYNKVAYVLRMIELDPANDSILRPIFDSISIIFKDRMPVEFWGAIDAHEIMYQGFMHKDTAKLIQSNEMLSEITNDSHGDISFQLAELRILFGEFAEGKEVIEQFVEGQYRSNNAYRYLSCQWLLGRAHEGLGDTQKAIEKYKEVLKFWGKTDIQIKIVRDTKQRLARLTS